MELKQRSKIDYAEFENVWTVRKYNYIQPQNDAIASFDTTDAIPGAYVVEADDGDGHTDTATVNILSPVT